MRALGFYSVPCGQDGPGAWAIAEQWNARWQAVRRGNAPSPAKAAADNLSPERSEELTVYPVRSLGEAFRRYRRTDEWASKEPRTREDWWRGWKRIKPIFADCDLRTVSLEDISAWRKAIEETVSLREAHRCLKIWRAMWKVAAALGYCVRDADPSLGVRNRASPGRSATWTEGEVVRLYKRAFRDGYHGLAAVIAVAWSTQMSPGDVRTLRASQLARNVTGAVFFTARSAALSVTARWLRSKPTLTGSALNCMARLTFSATAAARPIRATRSAMISATFAASCLANESNARSPISAVQGRSRPSLAVLTPRNWRTPWETRCRLQTPYSRPTSR